jgi:FKBP-type peptidyl-prolyl cis-trans isomerase FkpA
MQDFITKLEADTGQQVQKTASGLMYLMLEDGDGTSPTADSDVEVHYRGTFLDGREFDSSYKRGQTITFPLSGVIPGWTEGVQLMKPGGKCKLICPPDLAYGKGGAPPVIPPDTPLVFDIELVSVR